MCEHRVSVVSFQDALVDVMGVRGPLVTTANSSIFPELLRASPHDSYLSEHNDVTAPVLSGHVHNTVNEEQATLYWGFCEPFDGALMQYTRAHSRLTLTIANKLGQNLDTSE